MQWASKKGRAHEWSSEVNSLSFSKVPVIRVLGSSAPNHVRQQRLLRLLLGRDGRGVCHASAAWTATLAAIYY